MSHPMLQTVLQPERAVSPFIAFCKAKRDEVKAANPTAKFGDMSKLLSALWKELSENEKMAYVNSHQTVDKNNKDNEPELRRSARLRNKRLGLNFWGNKL